MGADLETIATPRPKDVVMKRSTLILAIAAGLNVANVYSAQPLLDLMASDFGISAAKAGLIITMTQVGYGFGLIFLVPLGDIVNRRRLIMGLTMISAIALTVVATAQVWTVLLTGVTIVGLLAVNVQLLVSFAATLASPQDRGKAVGIVTSGVVIGILAARLVAGALTDLGGWRAVYLTFAFLMVAIAWGLKRILPPGQAHTAAAGYMPSILSMPRLFLRDRILLLRGILALLIFAAFSTFWTTLVLPLSTPPFLYSHTEIGLFGLVGMVGALAAAKAGKLADRGFGQWTTGSALLLLLASWGLIAMLPSSILFLIVGVVLMDLAVQAVHVTSQSILLVRYPEVSSGVIGFYMVFYSIGSATGAATATIAFSDAGWLGVSLLGAAYSVTAFILWGLSVVCSTSGHR